MLSLEALKRGLQKLGFGLLPTMYSMADENNIFGMHNDYFIITKREHLVGGLSLEGVPYSSLDEEAISRALNERILALNEISEFIHLKVLARRRKLLFNKTYQHVQNHYAKTIINIWEKNEEVYQNTYLLLLETKNDDLKGFLERQKKALTTDELEGTSSTTQAQSVQNAHAYLNKEVILHSIMNNLMQILAPLAPQKLSALELLRFYAEYSNGVYLPLNFSDGMLHDGHIASHITFKKDHFVYDYNGQQLYKRIIAVKAYDSDTISSIPISSILHLKSEFDVILSMDTLPKAKSIKKIEEKRKRANAIIKPSLEHLNNLVKTDRVLMQYVSLMVHVRADSKETLDAKSLEIVNTFKRYGLVAVHESLNMMCAFFSLFPGRNHLNARKRLQSSQNIASMIMLEKEESGFDQNPWGEMPLSVFKNQNYSPFLFNFHAAPIHSKEDMPLGHTLVIGGTGVGKTTLVEFLITNCFKYSNLNILALDRLNGMRVMGEFLEAEYNDGNAFHINPFSLEDDNENKEFLKSWLHYLVNVSDNNKQDVEDVLNIDKVIEDAFLYLKNTTTAFGLLEIAKSIQESDSNLKLRLQKYAKNELFNKIHDCLSFSKKLTIINMDTVVQNDKNASLIALYLFHKMIYEAKKHRKGFFMFIDEARSYVNNATMVDRIKLVLTQARKVNGVLALAFQDINQLDEIPNAKSIVDNTATCILFPGANTRKLLEYDIPLSHNEISFLQNTSSSARKILVKNKLTNSSNFLDVDLSKLERLLKIYSSSAPSVARLESLKAQYPSHYKEKFLEE
ncbi:type IV secretion system DNA-binding domain-containing protein [Helicobacter baculiformis]|uniref:Type IV secretion system DNA-binding domain-containing protein n=1 Tax=Helicobacter baculiformis TaxID=427351 RepID=A0ABV7ZIV0_9HELI|nr:type IV secretion system DNA-binding domain-containing protein [Helicobacter baculiformis]